MNLYQMKCLETGEILEMSRPYLSRSDLKMVTDMIQRAYSFHEDIYSVHVDICRDGKRLFIAAAHKTSTETWAIAIPMIFDLKTANFCELSAGSGIEMTSELTKMRIWIIKQFVDRDCLGIECNCMFEMAEKAGLYTKGTYGSDFSKALEQVCIVDSVLRGNDWLYNVFRLQEDKR